jgi:hypothetical protein
MPETISRQFAPDRAGYAYRKGRGIGAGDVHHTGFQRLKNKWKHPRILEICAAKSVAKRFSQLRTAFSQNSGF